MILQGCADNVQLHSLEKGILYASMLVEKALMLATAAHAGQKDRNGVPYILHPIAVAMKQKTDRRIAIALLHDTLEDTELTYADIRDECGDDVALGVWLLTRYQGMTWDEYIGKICGESSVQDDGRIAWFSDDERAHSRTSIHIDAMHVKLADLEHNTDIRRMDFRVSKKMKRYIDAYAKISKQLSISHSFPTLS